MGTQKKATSKGQTSIEAQCDYCHTTLGCQKDSVRAREYWKNSSFGLHACNSCLPKIADDFAHLAADERLLALRLHWARGVNLPLVEETIREARTIIHPAQVAKLREDHALVVQLHNEGELVAAVMAAQALWNSANHLRDSMDIRPLVVKGTKFTRPGRGKGPIRKAIRKLLARDPSAKNAAIWSQLKAKPPKNHTVRENPLGKYIEGPDAGENMDYRRFQNVCAEERRELKSHG